MSYLFPQGATIAVGMSGGVDSSVSAYLLKEAGYQVVGLFMRNWEDENSQCQAADDAQDVAKVCDKIGIPYYGLNFTKEYKDEVFADFLKKLKEGKTPNPDILCNKEIKFKLLLDSAIKLGASALATGHYARSESLDGNYLLKKGLDETKDQTYFIYTLNQEILKKILFPIGHLRKSQVREIARAAGLATAEKKDSTGICFIGKRNFRSFLHEHLPYRNGLFKKLSGEVVGEHHGVAYYTIGQRKGLAIGGKGDAWFVVAKDPIHNIVYVEQGSCHPALFATELKAYNASWVSTVSPATPFHCKAKIRYRQQEQECIITSSDNGVLHVQFSQPMRAITEEQSIVFYEGDTCLGGAIIDTVCS